MLAYLPLEERWNVYSHGFGVLCATIGMTWFITFYPPKEFFASLGLWIYGFSMIFLFLASSIYHAMQGEHKALWQKIDHVGIYCLIAGTYTPVSLTILQESSGNFMLIVVWSIAIIGTIYKLFFINRFQKLSLFLYLAMGWLVVVDFKNVMLLFPEDAFYLLTLGGFFYTFGAVFYQWNSLYFNHVIWHLFVLFGAGAHFLMIFKLYSTL